MVAGEQTPLQKKFNDERRPFQKAMEKMDSGNTTAVRDFVRGLAGEGPAGGAAASASAAVVSLLGTHAGLASVVSNLGLGGAITSITSAAGITGISAATGAAVPLTGAAATTALAAAVGGPVVLGGTLAAGAGFAAYSVVSSANYLLKSTASAIGMTNVLQEAYEALFILARHIQKNGDVLFMLAENTGIDVSDIKYALRNIETKEKAKESMDILHRLIVFLVRPDLQRHSRL
jgi:hypothetical protein